MSASSSSWKNELPSPPARLADYYGCTTEFPDITVMQACPVIREQGPAHKSEVNA